MIFCRASIFAQTALLAIFLLVLTGCGGGNSGFPPVVTGFQAKSVQYSRTAVIYIGGNDLRSTMTVDTAGACSNPSFASSSSTSMLVLNCTVTQVGDMALKVKDAAGQVVYQTTVFVPKPQVTLTTNSNEVITLELDPAKAPTTVNNFLSYVNSGFYANTLFHRVVPGFVVQAGGFNTGMVAKSELSPPIVLESNKGLSNLRATVAMARLGDDPKDPVRSANSATSQFFINLVDNTFLDYQDAERPGYAVFGTVVQGMSVADAMATLPTSTVNGYANVPLTEVTITSATQTK